jgi:hypothetical protein
MEQPTLRMLFERRPIERQFIEVHVALLPGQQAEHGHQEAT